MSAFIVDKSHINAMLQGSISVTSRHGGSLKWHNGELTHLNADKVGQMLLDENIESVQYRYPDGKLTELPGRTDCEYILPFQHHPMGKVPKPMELIKITRCYEYQACEHPGWEDSEAKSFCGALIEATIPTLPGYDEAPWAWEEELPATKPVRLV